MAEPLKNQFGVEVIASTAESIASVYDTFDRQRFLAFCESGFEDLELTPRARQISDGLAMCLPADRAEALRILIRSLEWEPPARHNGHSPMEQSPMAPFRFMPHVYFVADYGVDHFELAMEAQYELTQLFTAEFSIRTFLETQPEATLDRLHVWAGDESEHVRRLVSEGTRPRLPWAPRLKEFQRDPAPVIELLELLKDDPEEYVRRSVANNLNDISKDHPELAVEVAQRWWAEADKDGRRMVRHGLRTLIKATDPSALGVLGYSVDTPAEIASVKITPTRPEIGGKVRIEVAVINSSQDSARVLMDLRVHFVKANGSTSPKVFKGTELTLGAGEQATVSKSISLAQHSTRTHHPGTHRVEVLLNGNVTDGGQFELESPD